LKEIEAVASGMLDLESGLRGYIVTGEEHLLDLQEQTKIAVRTDCEKVRGLTVDNDSQQRRLDRLEPLIAMRIDFGNRAITARREQGFSAAEQMIASGQGIALSNDVRVALKEMRDEEYSLLERRRKQSQATSTTTFLLLPLGLFVSLTLLSLALFFLNVGIRERMQAEQASLAANQHLRSSEERFRLLVSGVKDYAIFMLDPQGRVANWNGGAQRLKGWPDEEIIGHHFSEFYSPDNIAGQKPQRDLEVAEVQGRFEEEGWRFRKDRARFWAQVVITPVEGGQGSLAGFAIVTRDLTERRRSEQAAKKEEARLAAVIDSAMDAVVTVDESHRITLFNPAAEKMFSCRAADAMVRPLDQFLPERFRRTHDAHIGNFEKTKNTGRKMGELGAIYGLRSTGEEFPIEASISQVQIGEQRLFSVILRDITERKLAEEALRQQASLLDLTPVLVRDMDSRVVFWSSGLEKLYGHTKRAIGGMYLSRVIEDRFPRPAGGNRTGFGETR
jgi:PAS domain S-box-containing protein